MILPVSTSPRSLRTHAQVVESARMLLATEPFDSITIDRISCSSGVSTATLYKHWPSKTAIVAEAFGRTAAEELPIVQTDDTLRDLVEFAVRAMAFHGLPGQRVFVELLSACAVEPHGAAYLQEYYLGPRRAAITPLWERAQHKGLVRADVDVDLALDVLFGAAVLRLLRGRDVGLLRTTIEVSVQALIA